MDSEIQGPWPTSGVDLGDPLPAPDPELEARYEALGALDRDSFGRATVDVVDAGWDFWSVTEQGLESVGREYGIASAAPELRP